MGKYDPLRDWLRACGEHELNLSFARIEQILGFPLPPSAVRHAQWWENPGNPIAETHPQARAWHDGGYKACADRAHRSVTFTRLDTAKAERAAQPAEKEIELGGYRFAYIQPLIPERENGRPIRCYPQAAYANTQHLALNRYGGGAFCRFRITAPSAPGVYLWMSGCELLYIGETCNLARRFNTGYGYIEPRNCYEGGQSTNCRMNKVVLDRYEQGTPVELYFCATTEHKQVEKELLRRYRTKYNKKVE